MAAFPNWQNFLVRQQRPATGCIAASYEMLLRAAGVPNINFATFQDDFDFEKNGVVPGGERNNFESVRAAVQLQYPHVEICIERWAMGDGHAKVAFIDSQIAQEWPTLLSLPVPGGWHIGPVIDADKDRYRLLHYVDLQGNAVDQWVEKAWVAHVHDAQAGGDDAAFLKR